jgi:hypothetical protein
MRDAHFKNSSGRVRTDDLQVNSLSLSQLSYRGTVLSTRIELVTHGTTVHCSTI